MNKGDCQDDEHGRTVVGDDDPEVVADRIAAVVDTIGDPARVIAGTDCGFDTAAGFRDVAEEVCWAKLQALAEGAAMASQRYF